MGDEGGAHDEVFADIVTDESVGQVLEEGELRFAELWCWRACVKEFAEADGEGIDFGVIEVDYGGECWGWGRGGWGLRCGGHGLGWFVGEVVGLGIHLVMLVVV